MRLLSTWINTACKETISMASGKGDPASLTCSGYTVHEYSCQEWSQCFPDLKKNPSPGHGEKAKAVEAVPRNGQDWQGDNELIFPEGKDP